MPSSKRRSSTGGQTTPSKPPLPSAVVSDGRSTPPPMANFSPKTPGTGNSGTRILESPTSDSRFSAGGFKATIVSVDDKDVKGRALIWLSEQAMLSAPISTGSLIAVCVLSPSGRAEAIHGSLDSVRDSAIMECGVEVPRNETPGAVMAVAIAWPSRKLVKNDVRLSRVLSYSLGFPNLGTNLILNALHCRGPNTDSRHASVARQESDGAVPAVLHECSGIFLRWCPMPQQPAVTPVLPSFPSFSKDQIAASSLSIRTPRRQGKQELSRTSLSSPAHRSSYSDSPVRGETPEKMGVHEHKSDTEVPRNWDAVWAAFGKGNEDVRSLLEGFAARWIAGRYLLPGNVVQISLLGSDCLMLVTETLSSAQPHVSMDEAAASLPRHDLDEDTMISALTLTPSPQPVALYHLSLNTKVTLLPPVKEGGPVWIPQSTEDSSTHSQTVQEQICKGVSADADRIEYSALGGLSAQIEKLQQQVELSLLYPDHLTRYGLQPVRGILLHGPPGTGKSSLARAVACEAGVKMFAINGPEIVSEFYGESESALRAIFTAAAREAPSVVFIDELDSVVPERKDGSEELGQRLVAALLTLMDGGAEDTLKRILVIAATNRIDSIDPALRRPGRFDLEIEIGVPSPLDRLGILKVLLRDLRHTLKPSEISELAATTHGFVGADLAALCNEAAMSTLRRNVQRAQGCFGGSQCTMERYWWS